jgi:hypothetical protein
MQRLDVSGAVRPIYASLGFKGLNTIFKIIKNLHSAPKSELMCSVWLAEHTAIISA